ncbi:MAG: DsbA family oxidoreductase [Sideroxyarcus sp.]
MQIEIWSDIICPWCYIGKRRFETALADFAHKEKVQVVWRSFELDPDSPRQLPGSLEEMLAQKYGVSPLEAAAMNARVTQVANETGLEYHLADARPGNTFDAHRLLHFAASRQLGDSAAECLMHAYFSESLVVGDPAALARLAPEFGIAENEALAILQSDAYSSEVRADEARAASFGIATVPFFVFDENSGISGAQPVDVFSAALLEAWTERR